jgi:glycosyltransferase involved in cell wall biosynthesis
MGSIKILFALEATTGGALKHVTYLACTLRKSDYEITVALSPLRANTEELEKAVNEMRDGGVEVLYISMSRSISLLADVSALLVFVRLLAARKFDVVHAHSSKAGALVRVAAWMTRIGRVFYTPHCFYFQAKKRFIPKFGFYLLEAALGTITDSIIVSDNEKEAARRFGLIPERKLLTINNAIQFRESQTNVDVAGIRKKLGLEDDHFVVAAIGRLDEQKDLETFLKAASIVIDNRPNCRFLIVGDGPLRLQLEKCIADMGLSEYVTLTGFIGNIQHIYSIIDVLVSTSLWEGLPYVLLEGMQFRKPIIATNLYTPNTIKHEETGFVCHCKDHKSIATQIMKLVDDRLLLVRMGNNAYEHASRRFHFQTFLSRHESLYANDTGELEFIAESPAFPG